MIVAGFSGIGKSYFAILHPDITIDFVCMPYKYFLDPKVPFDESSKADLEMEMRPEWPLNYFEAIKNCPTDKIILIPSDTGVLRLLKNDGIPYYLCYPTNTKKAKKVYRERFIKRGNSQEFLSIFIGEWDTFMDSLREDTFGRHIVLKPKQYLSDVLDIKAILNH